MGSFNLRKILFNLCKPLYTYFDELLVAQVHVRIYAEKISLLNLFKSYVFFLFLWHLPFFKALLKSTDYCILRKLKDKTTQLVVIQITWFDPARTRNVPYDISSESNALTYWAERAWSKEGFVK